MYDLITHTRRFIQGMSQPKRVSLQHGAPPHTHTLLLFYPHFNQSTEDQFTVAYEDANIFELPCYKIHMSRVCSLAGVYSFHTTVLLSVTCRASKINPLSEYGFTVSLLRLFHMVSYPIQQSDLVNFVKSMWQIVCVTSCIFILCKSLNNKCFCC